MQARLADGDARAHSDLGTALLATNQIPRAIAGARARRSARRHARRRSLEPRLRAISSSGAVADAIAKYREALRLDDKLASAWINLATALAHDPKTRAEARAALLDRAEIDPTDPRVKANLEELDALEKSRADVSAPRDAPDALTIAARAST